MCTNVESGHYCAGTCEGADDSYASCSVWQTEKQTPLHADCITAASRFTDKPEQGVCAGPFRVEECRPGTFRVAGDTSTLPPTQQLKQLVEGNEAPVSVYAHGGFVESGEAGAACAMQCSPCPVGTHSDNAGSSDSADCLTCAIETRCAGGCTEGHTGSLCGKCADSFYEFQNNCRACPGAYEWCDCKIPWMFIVVLLVLVLICLAAAKGDMSRWEVVAAMKQVTTYAQIIGISHLCNVVWPENYLGAMEVSFKLVSFDFMEVATPECFIDGWSLTWDGRYLGSIAVTAGLFVLVYVSVGLRRGWDHHRKMELRRRLGLLLYVIVYTTLATKSTQAWLPIDAQGFCELDGEGRTYQSPDFVKIPCGVGDAHDDSLCPGNSCTFYKVLAFDTEVDYTSSWHIFAQVLSLSILLGFVLAIPAWIGHTTHRLRQQDRLRDPETKRVYGSLYDKYKDSHVDFEVYSLLRRGFSAISVVAARGAPIVQTVFLLLINFLYLSIVYVGRPFAPKQVKMCSAFCRFDVFNDMEIYGTVIAISVQLLALVLALASDTKMASIFTVLAVILAVVAIGFLAVLITHVVLRIRKSMKARVSEHSDPDEIVSTLNSLRKDMHGAKRRGSFVMAEEILRKYQDLARGTLFYHAGTEREDRIKGEVDPLMMQASQQMVNTNIKFNVQTRQFVKPLLRWKGPETPSDSDVVEAKRIITELTKIKKRAMHALAFEASKFAHDEIRKWVMVFDGKGVDISVDEDEVHVSTSDLDEVEKSLKRTHTEFQMAHGTHHKHHHKHHHHHSKDKGLTLASVGEGGDGEDGEEHRSKH